MNIVMYEGNKQDQLSNIQFFVSETQFDRNMSWLVHGANSIRTIIFPSTVRDVSETVFKTNRSLRSAVLNEGLERLGELRDENKTYYDWAFKNTKIK